LKSLVAFIEELTKHIGIPTPVDWQQMSDVEIARLFLKDVNEFFYQTYSGIGTTTIDGEAFQ
jgi:hypothetical protein